MLEGVNKLTILSMIKYVHSYLKYILYFMIYKEEKMQKCFLKNQKINIFCVNFLSCLIVSAMIILPKQISNNSQNLRFFYFLSMISLFLENFIWMTHFLFYFLWRKEIKLKFSFSFNFIKIFSKRKFWIWYVIKNFDFKFSTTSDSTEYLIACDLYYLHYLNSNIFPERCI